MKILLAHPGTQYSFHLARQLEKNNLLYRFYTGIAFGDGSLLTDLLSILPHNLFKKISNRFLTGVPDNKIERNIRVELAALQQIKKGLGTEDVFRTRNEKFQRSIPDSALKAADVVIGFDTSSWILGQRCKDVGTKFILDVSIAHPIEKQKIFEQILQAYPAWSFTIKQKNKELIDLELQEFELADKIVVASSFSKNTLVQQGTHPESIAVNPYGTDLLQFRPSVKNDHDKVKFVFVGLVDARKGVPVLLNAWKLVDNTRAELTLIGPIAAETEALVKNDHPEVVIKGKLPYKILPAEFAKHDVLVFPSYFEGFALVIPEAMACGLAVITTPATCGPDILNDGESGFVIPCGDEQMLFNKIFFFIENKQQLERMKKKANISVQSLTWDQYGKRWRDLLNNLE